MAHRNPKVYEEEDDYIYDYNTTNVSFLHVASTLKKLGVKNYRFFLKLYDEDLVGINPHDKNLSDKMKMKVGIECTKNLYYFLREVFLIPEPGKPTRFQLHRGNLAALWAFSQNINLYLVLPRQHGKTWVAIAYATWLFNFATRNAKLLFMNKQLKDSQENLKRLKEARELLPDYLQLIEVYDREQGKMVSFTSNMGELCNYRKNEIITKASANNPNRAEQLGRGLTIPWLWFDEFAFTMFNEIMWAACIPAWSKAHDSAIENNVPSSIAITTTPGDRGTPFGEYAHKVKELSGRFYDQLYDKNSADMAEWLEKSAPNRFIYIEYSYTQLGHEDPQEWYEKMVRDLNFNMPKVRREILLQWTNSTSNSPFEMDDLNELRYLTLKPSDAYSFDVIKNLRLNVYHKLDVNRKYIVSIDPSKMRGDKADNTALVVVDAETQQLCAVFKSNRIGYKEFHYFLEALITYYIPNSVIVVENNIGDAVIEYIKNSKLRHLLYYEFKKQTTTDKRKDGVVQEQPTNDIVYGICTTAGNRPKYFDILFDYVANKKELIACDELVTEIETLEYKNNDRVDHAKDKHDDVTLAYLISQYVMMYGNNKARFGLFNSSLIAGPRDGMKYNHLNSATFDNSPKNTEKEKRRKSILTNPFFQRLLVKRDTIEELRVKWYKKMGENINRDYGDFNENDVYYDDDEMLDSLYEDDSNGFKVMKADVFETVLNVNTKKVSSIWDDNNRDIHLNDREYVKGGFW